LDATCEFSDIGFLDGGMKDGLGKIGLLPLFLGQGFGVIDAGTGRPVTAKDNRHHQEDPDQKPHGTTMDKCALAGKLLRMKH
jgi:hypothetical protein